ncbi:hypothetical protein Leryth_001014 [Lithospermum erythrorhizon]|uniref:DUF7865 domain-containing protein n=1 Tax=Lithospermum erythrorhizon TaxID=34254 RepID=A0AAV3QYX4_LITER|nr:hypothetical protein Leryth_001014 [Lithospermum erythrorhizon]
MGPTGFFLMCGLHGLLALSCGILMMFYSNEFFVFSHGKDHASKLLGSTPHDALLIRTSDSFSGLLLCAIGFLLFMVGLVKDREFQGFFARGCVMLHVSMAIWRYNFERKLDDLGHDWMRLVVADIALALSWIFFLVYTWREKYD